MNGRLFLDSFLEKAARDRYTTNIEWIGRSYGLEVFYQEVTRQEKDLIVKAMGLTQGHWFKCPKGKYDLSSTIS